jgi:hypothetical protein
MDDEDEITDVVEVLPLRHTRWSILVIGMSYAAGLARETADFLASATMMTAQHNLYKREEDEFYEVVKNG